MTFHVRETIWGHGKIKSNMLLPTMFETWSEAVRYLQSRQKAYATKGYDEKQDEWWARNLDEGGVTRWTIEEDDEN